MLKILTALAIILISQITPLVIKTQASEPCTSSAVGISYGNPGTGTKDDKTWFAENSGDLNLEFTMNSNNALIGKEVYLHLPGGWWIPGYTDGTDNKDSAHATANTSFILTVSKDYTQATRGDHEGVLYWPDPKNSGKFTEYCSRIKYKVGLDRCAFLNLPAEVRPIGAPNSSIYVQFLGKANKEYTFAAQAKELAKGKTSSNGLGIFENINIPGSIGDKIGVSLTALGTDNDYCSGDLRITANAPPQPSPNPSPVLVPPAAPNATPCIDPDKCTSGGGNDIRGCNDPKDPNDPNKPNPNPGVATAIGCIHTNPTEFVKDLMKFGVGIGGGLAFLMMLLGAFQMLTSSGNPETLNAGKDRLTSAVIGLLFIIFAVLLLKIIGVDILGLGDQFGYKP